MSCCGKRRDTWRGETAQIPPASFNHSGQVYFRYVGNTALTVIGPVTGRTYKFSAGGAVSGADLRDAPSLAAVPHLRQVSNP